MKNILLFFFLYSYSLSSAQPAAPVVPKHLYGVKNPEIDVQNFCKRCHEIMRNKPEEVGMAIQYNKADNFLYYFINDKQYFDLYFTNPFDGIAADILYKDQYACNLASINKDVIGPLHVYVADAKVI